MTHDRGGGVRHCLAEAVLLRMEVPGLDVVGRCAARVDECLACSGGAADGELLERTAVAAHGMTLEMREDEHGIIVFDVFSEIVLLEYGSVGDLPTDIRTFGVHQIHRKALAPTVIFDQLQMGSRVVPNTAEGVAVSCVALDDGAVNALDHRTPEIRTQEILISLLARVELDGNAAWKLEFQCAVHLHDLFRCDLT